MRDSLHSSLQMYTSCEDYDKIWELGGSIISHLMIAYAGKPWGFWYELLRETVHGLGKETGLSVINSKE